MVESANDRKEKDGSDLSQGPCQVLHHRCNYQLHLWKWEKLRNCLAKLQKTLTRHICGRNVTEQKYASHVMAKDLAPSRSPTVGWLAMHFLPGRKWEFFPTCESSSRSHPVIWFRSPFSKSVPGNWHPNNQPMLKTGSPPTLTTADISHGGDVHSPTAGAWLTHLRALAAHFTPLGHLFNVYVHIATCTIITNKHWLRTWQWFGSFQIRY